MCIWLFVSVLPAPVNESKSEAKPVRVRFRTFLYINICHIDDNLFNVV